MKASATVEALERIRNIPETKSAQNATPVQAPVVAASQQPNPPLATVDHKRNEPERYFLRDLTLTRDGHGGIGIILKVRSRSHRISHMLCLDVHVTCRVAALARWRTQLLWSTSARTALP